MEKMKGKRLEEVEEEKRLEEVEEEKMEEMEEKRLEEVEDCFHEDSGQSSQSCTSQQLYSKVRSCDSE